MPGHYTAKQKKNRKVGGEIRQQQQLEEYKKRERRRVLEEKLKKLRIKNSDTSKKNTHKKGDPEKDYSKPLPGAKPGWNIAKKKKKKKYTA